MRQNHTLIWWICTTIRNYCLQAYRVRRRGAKNWRNARPEMAKTVARNLVPPGCITCIVRNFKKKNRSCFFTTRRRLRRIGWSCGQAIFLRVIGTYALFHLLVCTRFVMFFLQARASCARCLIYFLLSICCVCVCVCVCVPVEQFVQATTTGEFSFWRV